jgi:hypothetical protein
MSSRGLAELIALVALLRRSSPLSVRRVRDQPTSLPRIPRRIQVPNIIGKIPIEDRVCEPYAGARRRAVSAKAGTATPWRNFVRAKM